MLSPKLGRIGKNVAVHMASFLLIASIISAIPIYEADGANALLLRNLTVRDIVSDDTSEVTIDSVASFSVSLTNNNQSSQPYVIIFDVRDSKGVSVMLGLAEGSVGKYTTAIVASNWIPDKLGAYTIRTFALSDTDHPEILAPVISAKFEVIEQQEEPLPQEEETVQPPSETTEETIEEPTLEELRQYALERINEDREAFGLAPVELSDNEAAQVHAQDMFETKFLSHWMSNGEKPYMTYTRYGGIGHVEQNIAYSGYTVDYDDCVSGDLICEKVDPWENIDDLEYLMVYDDADSDWGHRDNILDKYHTHVSIGIVYDDYFFSFVQNFENKYITKARATDTTPVIKFKEPTLTIEGKITEGQFSPELGHANTVTIYYDPLPTADTYKFNKHNLSYGLGDYVACVLQEQQTMYCPGATTLTAQVWDYENTKDYDTFLIRASLSSILDEPGVYTVILTAEPIGAGENAENWVAASGSIWYE